MSSVLDAIGHTPLVKLQRLNQNPLATILMKMEFLNPSGSVKDRIVLHIINHAEAHGLLKPGGTIVENTSGNTGAAAAMVAAIRGYQCILTLPDKVSQEKQNTLKALGAKIIVCPTDVPPTSPEHYIKKAVQIAQETPNSFRINQYDNPLNPEAHYLTTGPEIWEQTGGKVDYFISSGSTGGTISGAGRYLKEKNPALKIILPDPVGSIYYSYFKTGNIPKDAICNYKVEGIGEDHLAKAMDFSIIDDVVQVSDKDSFWTARELAQKEGILAGGSSGTNLFVTLNLAANVKVPTTFVTLLADGGIKYLSKMYDDNWMKEYGFWN